MLGTLLAVLRNVQKEQFVIVHTDIGAAAFFCIWAKENGILNGIYKVSKLECGGA